MTSRWQLHLLCFSQFVMIACLDMSDPYWPLILQHTDTLLSPNMLQYWSAAIYMLPFIATVIATPIWTQWGDKIGQKKMLLRACAALVVTQFLLAYVTAPSWILVVRLAQGVFAGFSAAAQAWAVTVSMPNARASMIGHLQASTAIGTIVGPVLGGMIAQHLGYLAIFHISAGLLASVMLLLGAVLTEADKKYHRDGMSNDSWRWYQLSAPMWFALGMICFTQAARWMSTSFFALYVAGRLQGNVVTVGVLYAVIATAMFVTAPRWGNFFDKQTVATMQRWLAILLILASVSQCGYAFATQMSYAFLASILWGVCLGGITLIPFAQLVRITPLGQHGKPIGLGSSASKLGNFIGVGLGATIQAMSNFTWSFCAIMMLYVTLASVVYLMPVHLRRLEMEPC